MHIFNYSHTHIDIGQASQKYYFTNWHTRKLGPVPGSVTMKARTLKEPKPYGEDLARGPYGRGR